MIQSLRHANIAKVTKEPIVRNTSGDGIEFTIDVLNTILIPQGWRS